MILEQSKDSENRVKYRWNNINNIPEEVIRRRFKAGLANFHEHYSKIVDSWAFYDSSGMHPKLIDWSNK
jgi:predicted ABC-type ATPase